MYFSRQWSGDEESDGTRSHQTRTEHPLTEATIPLVTHSRLQDPSTLSSSNVIAASGGAPGQNSHRSNAQQSQQESVLQKFRKSFSLRFHKKGSKESTEGECPAEENERTTGQLGEEEERETSAVLSSEQGSQHKDDPGNDQKFRFVNSTNLFSHCSIMLLKYVGVIPGVIRPIYFYFDLFFF